MVNEMWQNKRETYIATNEPLNFIRKSQERKKDVFEILLH